MRPVIAIFTLLILSMMAQNTVQKNHSADDEQFMTGDGSLAGNEDLDFGDNESIQNILNDPAFKDMPLHEELKKLMEEMSKLGMGKEDLENMGLGQEYMDHIDKINEVGDGESEF